VFHDISISLIEDGATPNIMSARAYSVVPPGLDGIAIFTAQGAVSFRATPQVVAIVARLIDNLKKSSDIEGSGDDVRCCILSVDMHYMKAESLHEVLDRLEIKLRHEARQARQVC